MPTMGPYGPGGGEGFERFGPMIDHHDTWWEAAFGFVPWVLLIVAIGVAIWAVLRLSSRPVPVLAAASVPGPIDPAVDELRIRYARGEVSREDFLMRGRDLGADLSADVSPTVPTPPEADRSD